MRVLFVIKQRNYVRTFAGVIRELAARGHHVSLAWQDRNTEVPEELSDCANLTITTCHSKRSDQWRKTAPLVRRASDYLRYLEPSYHGASKLRARAFEKLFHTLPAADDEDEGRTAEAGWSEIALALSEPERRRLRELTTLVEQVIPPDPGTLAFIRHADPDVLLISPLIDLGSGQTDYVKAAQALNIPVGMLLFSWDNLSTKGTLHVVPDRLFVWNDRLRREAVELHGIEPARVVVTGAPRFDPFFELQVANTREAFCQPLRFDPAEPILTYLCSSKFVSGDELTFVREWIVRLRTSTGRLAQCNVIVRPHPDVKYVDSEGPIEKFAWPGVEDARAWVTRPFDDPRVAVVRTGQGQPFYDCLHHSAAIVGLNTTAEIEAAIAGRPVFTVLGGSAVVDGQETTLHFHYLLRRNGGIVEVGTLDEHLAQIERAIANPPDAVHLRRFVKEFIRPAGLDRPVATVIADAVEEAFSERSRPRADASAIPQPQGLAAPEIGEVDYPGATIRVRVTADVERKRALRACAREPWTVRWIEEQLRPGDVMYDVGAGIGVYSIIAARRGVTVVSFEASAPSYARMLENIALNGCQAAVTAISMAVADITGVAGFKYRSMEPAEGRHRLSRTAWDPGALAQGSARHPMCVMRLDDAIAQFRLPMPHHLRVDVGGHEIRVLRGAAALLTSGQVQSVLVATDAETWPDVSAFLTGLGFASEAADRSGDGKPRAARFLRMHDRVIA